MKDPNYHQLNLASNPLKHVISPVKVVLVEEHETGILGMDIPSKIINARKEGDIVYCLIDWETRPNGVKPKTSEVTTNEFGEKYPYMLIEFYESKIIY